ncbi:ATP-grasp fold amidoligase family protein [Desulfovibrio sp.]
MCRIASILSKKFIFVRVDLFVSNDDIYVGELTFFPENATGKFSPNSASKWLLTGLRESSNLI